MEARYGDCCCASESFFSASSLLECHILCPQENAHQNACQVFCTEECDLALFEQRELKAVKDVTINLQSQSLFRTFEPLCSSSCASQSEFLVTNTSGHEIEVSRAQAESQSGSGSGSKAITHDVTLDSTNLVDSFATLKSPTLAGFNASTFDRLRLSPNVHLGDSNPLLPKVSTATGNSALRTADSRSSIGPASPAGSSMLGDDSRVRVYVTRSPTLAKSSHNRNASQFLLPPLSDSLCSSLSLSLSSPQLNKTNEQEKSLLTTSETPKKVGRSPSACDEQAARRILPRRMPVSLASSPLQDAARQLAYDIEQYLIVARARLAGAGNEAQPPLPRPKSPTNRKDQVALDENSNARRLEDRDSDNGSSCDDEEQEAAKRADIPVICVVQSQAADSSEYQLLVELERTRLRAEFEANCVRQQQASELRRKELESIGSTLSEQLMKAKQDNEVLLNLLRAQDRHLQLAGKLQRRNQKRLAEALAEERQLTAAIGEGMKLESTAQMTIAYYQQYDERAKSAKMHLEEALKKMVEACERLSNYTQAKLAQFDRKRAFLQHEAETQRSHLETTAAKLRAETDELKSALMVKKIEVIELTLFIANLNSRLGEKLLS